MAASTLIDCMKELQCTSPLILMSWIRQWLQALESYDERCAEKQSVLKILLLEFHMCKFVPV